MREKQRNQVKQYLSESFKSSESLHNLIPFPVLQHNNGNPMAAVASKSQPATTCSSPNLTRGNVNSKLFNHINGGTANSCGNIKGGSLSAAEMAHVQSLEYSSGQSTNSFPFALHHRFVAASPSDQTSNNPMSPTISSVATSVTSASEVSHKYDFRNFFYEYTIKLIFYAMVHALVH